MRLYFDIATTRRRNMHEIAVKVDDACVKTPPGTTQERFRRCPGTKKWCKMDIRTWPRNAKERGQPKNGDSFTFWRRSLEVRCGSIIFITRKPNPKERSKWEGWAVGGSRLARRTPSVIVVSSSKPMTHGGLDQELCSHSGLD